MPDFDPIKYENTFNITSAELWNIAEDLDLLNIISQMCEKIFDVQINCSFKRHNKILERIENDSVEFLFQTSRKACRKCWNKRMCWKSNKKPVDESGSSGASSFVWCCFRWNA